MVVAAGLAAFSLAFAACGGDDDEGTTPTTAPGGTTPAAASPTKATGGETDYSSLSGQVVVDGSSTVGPIAEAAAEEFGKVSDVQVSVGISGTGGGFEKFCRGETDISDASRAIKDSEKTACQGGSVEFVEIKVGIDALSVVVNPDNDWVDCLTWSAMRTIFDQGSAITNWNQVDPNYPDQALKVYSPGADSGTFDFFTEEINGKVDQFRNDNIVTFSEDDNVLVQGVESDKGGIGYFGFAYFQENEDKLKALGIDKDQDSKATPVADDKRKGCVEPGDSTVLDNSYSLSRPLFMYVNKKSLAEKPQVKGYMQFVLENSDLVSDVGYVKLPDADYTAGLNTLGAN
ncbi:MAG: PstS family phosphate ABC transporter substrate-binding protein [Chloroflexi bacterium]|nr:PstS family phosphate ABC transporter substrate-binding protein [Chloroflexota bacterium]